VALRSTQPLTETVPGIFPGGKGGRCVGLQACHLHVPTVFKSGSLYLLEPSGPVQVCNGIALPFYIFAPGWLAHTDTYHFFAKKNNSVYVR
jgi:hypothetical protein